jgi:hypothetical protein
MTMKLDRAILLASFIVAMAALPALAQDMPPPPPADELGAAEDAEPVLLRFDYEEGETVTYETTVDGVGSVHVMGQAQALDMSGKMQVKMKIEEIDEQGNFTMVTDVDIAELTVTMNGSPVPPPRQAIQMQTQMSPRGEILDMEMTQTVDKPNSETPWNSQITKMLTGGFDLNRMVLGQKIAAFPEEAVKPGDEWSGTAQKVELQGQTAPVEITTKYDGNIELEGRDCARLDSTMTMQSSALGELAAMLSMEGSTTTNTRTWFDLDAGRMFATMEKTQVSMQVNLPAEMTGAQGPAGVFLEMFVDTESKLLPAGE